MFYEEGNARSSVSDNGAYPTFCEDAANDEQVFANFKRHPDYSQIVTSLDRRQAVALMPGIRKHATEGPAAYCSTMSASTNSTPFQFSVLFHFRVALTIHAGDILHVIELVDSIGGALQEDLDGVVANPSTLRYIAVSLLLSARFGREFFFLVPPALFPLFFFLHHPNLLQLFPT